MKEGGVVTTVCTRTVCVLVHRLRTGYDPYRKNPSFSLSKSFMCITQWVTHTQTQKYTRAHTHCVEWYKIHKQNYCSLVVRTYDQSSHHTIIIIIITLSHTIHTMTINHPGTNVRPVRTIVNHHSSHSKRFETQSRKEATVPTNTTHVILSPSLSPVYY